MGRKEISIKKRADLAKISKVSSKTDLLIIDIARYPDNLDVGRFPATPPNVKTMTISGGLFSEVQHFCEGLENLNFSSDLGDSTHKWFFPSTLKKLYLDDASSCDLRACTAPTIELANLEAGAEVLLPESLNELILLYTDLEDDVTTFLPPHLQKLKLEEVSGYVAGLAATGGSSVKELTILGYLDMTGFDQLFPNLTSLTLGAGPISDEGRIPEYSFDVPRFLFLENLETRYDFTANGMAIEVSGSNAMNLYQAAWVE